MKRLTLGLISMFAASSLFAGTYNVDAAHSAAGFSVKHMMVTNVNGKFTEFSGTFELDEKTKKIKSINAELSVNSIDTANAKRDGHLKSADFFDVDNFPKITFKSTKIEKNKVYGDLTIKGVTKNVKLEVDDAAAFGTIAGFELEGKIKRSDFGITWNKVLEAGAVAVGDEVKIKIDVEGNLAQ